MRAPRTWPVSPGWQLLLADMKVDVTRVLRRADLPLDLFANLPASLTSAQYFGVYTALEEEADVPDVGLLMARSLSVEAFDPPLFAAMCSRDLNQAARRIAVYKPLICPLKVTVEVGEAETVLSVRWPAWPAPPAGLARAEAAFWISLVRMATRAEVRPTAVRAPAASPDPAWADWAGVSVTPDPTPGCEVRFSALDARRPFLTANAAMWDFFEPELRRRLAQLQANADTGERVRAALLELLPAGDASMAVVARKLGMSSRTLQRRLKGEGTTFQRELDGTRERLARHYLAHSPMPAAEISFLLGYADPNSFYRAFHAWTGTTPERLRATG